MSDRVLSTGAAREAFLKMQSIINGPLLEQIDVLITEGTLLGDADVWDGQRAAEFRNDWLETRQHLTDLKSNLEELRKQVAEINQNIMAAGGNS